MKCIRYICFSFAAGLSLARLPAQTTPEPQAPSAQSGESGNEAVELPSFEVIDTADKGYLAGNSVSATRINTPISELPFAISAFTAQFIEDNGARELYDVVRYASGVSNGSSEFLSGDSNFNIRGFKQFPEHDGFYEQRGNLYVDTADIDRVEVVKGPSALLYGAISPGGTVNYITKHAELAPFVTIDGQYGSFDFARATIDINQPIMGDKLLFRFNAAAENGYQWVTGTNKHTTILAPTLTWNVTPMLSLRVNYQAFDRRETPPEFPLPNDQIVTPNNLVAALYNPGYPALTAALTNITSIDYAMGYPSDASNPGSGFAPDPRFPYNGSYVSNHDWRESIFGSIDVEADATLGKHWKSRLNFNFNHQYNAELTTGNNQIFIAAPNSLVFNNGLWSVAPSWAALTSAQQVAAELAFSNQIQHSTQSVEQLQNGTPSPAIMSRQPAYSWGKSNNETVQWEMVGDYEFSWGKIKPLVGVFQDATGNYSYSGANSGTAASPNFRPWDIDPASPTAYMNSNTAFVAPQLTSTTANTLAFAADQAAYGLVNASFLNDTLYFVGGARYNSSQSQTTNFISATPVGQGYRTHYTTPQAGLGYKLLKDLMIYASYSTSYQLPSTTFLSNIETVNGVLKSVPTTQAVPTLGEGYEAGLKSNFLNGRVSSTLSVYNIQQTNIFQSVNEIINGLALAQSFQGAEVRSRGIEYEITLSPLDNWQVFASASEDDARNVKEPPGELYYLGAYPNISPKTLANLWTRYSFTQSPLRGLWVGGGFNFEGRAIAANFNAHSFSPSYILWNAAVGYDWVWGKTHLTAKINGENLTDRQYYPEFQVRGIPRHVMGSVSAKF